MKKKWYMFYLFFCIYLLSHIPAHAESKNVTQTINITNDSQSIVLIFKKNAFINDVYLTGPDGIRHSLIKENTGLQATDHYEVMSYKHPFFGNWTLSGPEQQVAEVLVLTQVDLKTNMTHDTYYTNEMLHLSASLQQAKQVLDSDKVIDHLNMTFELSNLDKKYNYVIPYDKDGVFSNSFILTVPPGNYKAIWHAENTYLANTNQYNITIEEMPLEQNINAEHDALMIKLMKPDLFQAGTLNIKVFYKDVLQKVTRVRTGYAWIMDLSALCHTPGFSEEDVLLEITVDTVSHRPTLFKLLLNGKLCTPNAKPMVFPTEKPKTAAAPAPAPAKPKAKTSERRVSLKSYTILSVIVLLLLAIGLIFVIVLGLHYRNKLNKIRDEL